MTSVVGILNKQGVAIAADSAVTRTRGGQRKYTKNGNKMVRLCETVPIAVMITGNADFLQTPWDVIVRRYRQKRGQLGHATVAEAAEDFFAFIQSDPVFWVEAYDEGFIRWLAERIFCGIVEEIGDANERNLAGRMCRPKTFVRSFQRTSASLQKKWGNSGVCPQFEDYSLEQFRSAAEQVISFFLKQKEGDDNDRHFPESVLKEIRLSLEEAIWMRLRTRFEEGPSATLVFAGYGKNQGFPSLVSAMVCEGFDRHVNYHIRPEDTVCIGDDKPVAICPFAQTDVIKAILRGIHIDWSNGASDVFRDIVHTRTGDLFQPSFGEEAPGPEFRAMLAEVDTKDLQRQFFKEGMRLLNKNQREWEKALKNSDLETLASLADCLIDLTGFHRILTFSQEGVGGSVDVAVISRNDGFTWLRRKSWYHKDGPMGV